MDVRPEGCACYLTYFQQLVLEPVTFSVGVGSHILLQPQRITDLVPTPLWNEERGTEVLSGIWETEDLIVAGYFAAFGNHMNKVDLLVCGSNW